MTLTSLVQTRDSERVSVFVNGEFALAVEKKTLAEFRLHQGMEITPELLTQLANHDQVQYLYRRMVEWWFRRPRSSLEIKMKLGDLSRKRTRSGSRIKSGTSAAKGDPGSVPTPSYDRQASPGISAEEKSDALDIVDAVMTRLQENGYTDEVFADWFARERAAQRKYGQRRVEQELLAKRVDREIAKAAVAKYFLDDELAAEVLEKKFGVRDIKEIKDMKQRDKAWRFMRTRGLL